MGYNLLINAVAKLMRKTVTPSTLSTFLLPKTSEFDRQFPWHTHIYGPQVSVHVYTNSRNQFQSNAWHSPKPLFDLFIIYKNDK